MDYFLLILCSSMASFTDCDGKLAINENIADIEGFRQAYYAYKSHSNSYGKEKKMPSLEKCTNERSYFSYHLVMQASICIENQTKFLIDIFNQFHSCCNPRVKQNHKIKYPKHWRMDVFQKVFGSTVCISIFEWIPFSVQMFRQFSNNENETGRTMHRLVIQNSNLLSYQESLYKT